MKIASEEKNNVSKSGKGKLAKPFLKWAGGKSQLLETFANFYPKELETNRIKNYYEPFIGGGAVFFDVVQKYSIEAAFLFDINEELILTYQVVQKDVNKLVEQLHELQNRYLRLNQDERSEFFYKVRNEFNKNRLSIEYSRYSEKWITRAAQIIFLNKTCFNGLFRFNSKGEFNVPAGRYKNPKILDEPNLRNVSKTLEIAEIRKADFTEITNLVKPLSFVYFDPPYRPLNKTSSFTSYSKKIFGDDEQEQLAAIFSELHQKGIKLMLSNSDPKNYDPDDCFFDELYKHFNIYRVLAKRSINSVASKRKAIKEIIVTNYAV